MDINRQHVLMQTGLKWFTIMSGAFHIFNDVSTLIKVSFVLE